MTKNLLLFETALLRADVSIHDLVPMIDYVIKEMVNVAAVQPCSYGCTCEVC